MVDDDLDKAMRDLTREIVRGDVLLMRLGQTLAAEVESALEQREGVFSRRVGPQLRSYKSRREHYCPGCGEVGSTDQLCEDCSTLNSDST